MAITLSEAAKLSQNDLQRGVIQTFRQYARVLDMIPFLEIEGNAYAYNEEAALPGVEFRAVNSAYSEATGTVNQKTETLVILGGDADVDKFIQRTRSNINDQRATQLGLKIKAASYKFQDTFINGDVSVDANSFDGLKKRLTGAQVLVAATNGIPVVGNGGTDVQAFLDQLDSLIAQALLQGAGGAPNLGGGAIFCNSLILGKIQGAMRRALITTTQRDEFGRPFLVYNGIPIFDIGLKADGTMILPQTETVGTSTDCSSIYAVRFGQDEGDQAVTGLTNGGVQAYDLGELETKPAFRHRVEFYCGIGVFGARAGARLTGIRNL